MGEDVDLVPVEQLVARRRHEQRPLAPHPHDDGARVENSSDSCLSGVFSTGQSGPSAIPSICASSDRKVSLSKVEGEAIRRSAASATSFSGEITTSMGR
jgi:hypothetical protein